MGWLADLLRGGRSDDSSATPSPQAQPEPASVRDDVPHLKVAVSNLVGEVNASAGVLPSVAVVIARRTTDTLMNALTFSNGDLGIDARIAVHGIATDYLPTTIIKHGEATRVGHADADAELIKQLSELSDAADRLLEAVRERTVLAQQSQGHFLKAKYEGHRGEGDW